MQNIQSRSRVTFAFGTAAIALTAPFACSSDDTGVLIVGTGGTGVIVATGGTTVVGTGGALVGMGGASGVPVPTPYGLPTDASVPDGAAGDGAVADGGPSTSTGGKPSVSSGGSPSIGGNPPFPPAQPPGLIAMRLVDMPLVADLPGIAPFTDAHLANPWGLAINPLGPFFWVANNHTGTATVYDGLGRAQPLVVTIPGSGADVGAPTGQVFNASTDFMGDRFIFDSEDGLITGWQAGTTATIRADQSAADAIYKGLTIVHAGSKSFLAATDFHNGTIDVYGTDYRLLKTTSFRDPDVPEGFAPFNVAALGKYVYVTYAKQDEDREDDVHGNGNGYVDVFNTDGTLAKRLVSQGALNSPWGLAIAPASYGALAGTLLVGNFGDRRINAYDRKTGVLLGTLTDVAGKPLEIEGLWSIAVGPRAGIVDLSSDLYYTAGPDDEEHGVFGVLTLPPR